MCIIFVSVKKNLASIATILLNSTSKNHKLYFVEVVWVVFENIFYSSYYERKFQMKLWFLNLVKLQI